MTTPLPDTLQIETTAEGTLRVTGSLDLATAPRLRTALAQALATQSGCLVLDVTGLAFCDSSGLSALVDAHNQLDGQGNLVLLGASDQLRQVLRITNLDSTFTLA